MLMLPVIGCENYNCNTIVIKKYRFMICDILETQDIQPVCPDARPKS